jgi:hypothetical protein
MCRRLRNAQSQGELDLGRHRTYRFPYQAGRVATNLMALLGRGNRFSDNSIEIENRCFRHESSALR